MKMNAELKQKWINALRSGEYIHGKGRLKKIEDGCTKHCCLGVLVEVIGHEIVPMKTDCGDGMGPISYTDFNSIKINDQIIGYEFFDSLMEYIEIPRLYVLNDKESTNGYDRQISYIEANL